MVTPKEIEGWAKHLADVVQQPHFNKTSFRIKKKIFSTLDDKKKILVIKLNEIDQSVFCKYDEKLFIPFREYGAYRVGLALI